MRRSKILIPTTKETPAEAELVSHQLMLRAGLIRKLASGLYSWLPLGLRVLRKVEHIVRQEMDRTGAQEVLMPAVQPAELWQQSGRWEQYGPELLRLQDRHQRDFCFGPTHEEIITDLMRGEIHSYKQLPGNFYQIQTKFRDEIRPRFGVMRAREFIMKDAYSFHLDKASLDTTYQQMYETYSRIFTRLGLEYRAVLADTGSIGGENSHEFHILADSGEDAIAYCPNSNYAANVELAPTPAWNGELPAATQTLQQVATPGLETINEVAQHLGVSAKQCVKTLIVVGSEAPLVALVLRGDHELNAIKAEKLPQIQQPLQFADGKLIAKQLGAEIGSLGPLDLNIPVLVDHAAVIGDFVCGANISGFHFTGVNWSRDLTLSETYDLRNIEAGDESPDAQGEIEICRGIEAGHIFQLGDKYSAALNATCLNEQGKQITMLMGCYGIGISRIVAAAIEQHHDQNGICWPSAIAPFDVLLLPMNMYKSEQVKTAAEKIYGELTAAGFEVLWDDRHERAGGMFADGDLIGIPHRIVVGERHLNNHQVEYKARRKQETELISITDLIPFLNQQCVKL
ncbi:MAG TPA: proline--tRNA ligase [Gammaproteobacteria bacterium]|nr:proline--tRNA ligase [Gammaproteobacteria bacterium]